MTTEIEGFCDVVGAGRMGTAVASALRTAGVRVRGPLGRGANGRDAEVVLLCVPDREIRSASEAIVAGPIVGHTSASTLLSALEPHESFVMHPLLSVAGGNASFAGATCAIDGTTERALAIASALGEKLGMRTRHIRPEQRALYHAAASAASNYITTVLGMAESLGGAVGLEREELASLVRSAVDNWVALGARRALTGPIARGDDVTVAKQRRALVKDAPQLLPLWDELALATLELTADEDHA